MKERPILFSAPMVRATLAGTKTQTRRVVKEPGWATPGTPHLFNGQPWADDPFMGDRDVPCPYGKPGDRLWGRETFFAWGRWETRYSAKKGRDEWHFVDMTLECGHEYAYAADGHSSVPHQRTAGTIPSWWKRPAIFMPRAASRILLEVTGVRVERLQDISEADAWAEGCTADADGGPHCAVAADPTARDWYADLWEQINGAGTWDANPWVWVVEFGRATP